MTTAERTEWLEWRRGGIGSSDVPAILGLSPWSSPLKVYMEKRGELPDDDTSTEAMRLGRLLEPVAGEIFTLETGLTAGHYQEPVTHPHAPWRRATVDFLAEEAEEAITPVGVVEVKTAGRLWTEPPIDAVIQTQWQLHVTGLGQAWILQLATGRGWKLFEIEPDAVAMERMVEAAEELWNRVQTGDPPKATGADLEILGTRWPKHTEGKTVEIPLQLIQRYRLARTAFKESSDLRDEVAAEIKAEMADAEAATVDGEVVLTWKAHTIAAHKRAASIQRRMHVVGE